jgi:hypothetical protein
MKRIINNPTIQSIISKYNITYSNNQLIYHYTTCNGLNGILSSKNIKATHAKYLNDWSEMLISYYKIYEILQVHTFKNDFQKELSLIIMSLLLKMIHDKEYPDIYVTSFSLNEDDILLWKSYGSFNDCYSIGFNPIFINSYALNKGAELLKCIYDEEIQNNLLKELVNYFFNNRPIQSNEFGINTSDFLKMINIFIPIIKNSKFMNENEVRLIYRNSTNATTFNEIKTGINHNNFYKFIEIPIIRDEINTEFEHAVSSITIGPNSLIGNNNFISTFHNFVTENILNMFEIKETKYNTLKY